MGYKKNQIGQKALNSGVLRVGPIIAKYEILYVFTDKNV